MPQAPVPDDPGASAPGAASPDPESFGDFVLRRRDDPGVGLVFEGQRWTWAQVVRECQIRAAALRGWLPVPQDRQRHVGVLLDNVPDHVFWIGAGALAGAAIVGINTTRRGRELGADIRHADCDVLIVEPAHREALEGADHGVPPELVFDIESAGYRRALGDVRVDPGEPPRGDAGDIAHLLFSSGSTGAPKAVILSRARFARLIPLLADRVRLRADSVTYLCMPLFHGNALMMNLAPAFLRGARVVLVRRFSASRFADDIAEHGVTFVNYVGRALSYVLAQPERESESRSRLELAFGTEASARDIAEFVRRFGGEVLEGYGASEGVVRIARTPDAPPAALGTPADGVQVVVLDDEGNRCPPGELDSDGRLRNPEAIGEMVALGAASRFEGYYQNPEAMASRVRGADYWSGDLAFADADGYLYFAGRSSDWLRVDGENLAAGLVERVLERWEPVSAAAVYAVADPQTGDRLMCALELREHARFDPAEFAAFLDTQDDFGTKWRPSFVRLTDALPLTGTGKIDKSPLRAQGWYADDPIWFRAARTAHFVPFGPDARSALERQFAEHGRAMLLPPVARSSDYPR